MPDHNMPPSPAADVGPKDGTGERPGDRGRPPAEARLPPIVLDALRITRRELAVAMGAGGPSLVALQGPEGAGKSYTLEALARASPSGGASVRTVGQEPPRGVALDLVDAVDGAALRSLAAEPAFAGCRVIAIRPDLADRLVGLFPAARIVEMRPIGSRDVRAILAAWRGHFRLPPDALTLKAVSLLGKLCEGNPGRLVRLANGALRASRAAHCPRVAAVHVQQAAQRLSAFAPAQKPRESTQPAGESRNLETNATRDAAPAAGRSSPGPEPASSTEDRNGSAWQLLTRPLTSREMARMKWRRRLRSVRAATRIAFLGATVAAAVLFVPPGHLADGTLLPRPHTSVRRSGPTAKNPPSDEPISPISARIG